MGEQDYVLHYQRVWLGHLNTLEQAVRSVIKEHFQWPFLPEIPFKKQCL
jgi:hypothetical protein